MEQCIVLYPSPAIGHLISMVELGKRILLHHPIISINILLTKAPYNAGSTAPYIKRISESYPSISFHHLPTLSIPLDASQSPHPETLTFRLFRHNNPSLHQSLTSISQTKTIRAFVLDGFCSIALDVTAQLQIPSYFFVTSGAGILANSLYFPTIHHQTTANLKDLNTLLHIPGLPPIPSSDMILPVLDRTDEAYQGFLNASIALPKASGIIVNTFESLEPRGLKAITDGLCVPNGSTPPIYCIGPLIASEDRSGSGGDVDEHECFRWLDAQPRRSVVFLCFGSLGLFSAAQLKEIAVGLENSGQRFLWVVRSPPTEEKEKRFLAPPEPDLDALLPEGFLDRTKERGLVVKSWAPQVAILNRESVGGFVTHCGWNSVLEAIWAGVPMVAWPLYAEQRLNRVLLVEEMKLAMKLEEEEGGSRFVSSSQVEKGVRGLMESEEGKCLSERTIAASQSAKKALEVGGSSHTALAELARSWN